MLSRQGADPRDFALLPFGGAGPMTACSLARDLGMTRIIAADTRFLQPRRPAADIRNDFLKTVFAEVDAPARKRSLQPLMISSRPGPGSGRTRRHFHDARLLVVADMRYRGQSYEIEVPLEAVWTTAMAQQSPALFHREHERVYEHADEKALVQIVNLSSRSAIAPQPALETGTS
ncbi:MAG: hydantoinase/oxoprolinase family protein [Hyphomicrobiaceae bacterium]